MNSLAHIFIGYIALSFVLPDASKYFLPIALFSMLPDIDHLPGWVRLATMPRELARKLTLEDIVSMFRTAAQEPIGILTVEAALAVLYLSGVQKIILLVAAWCIAIHWIVDLLTVHTRPFTPISNRIVSLFFHTKRQRLVSEALITALTGIVFAMLYF